jgi:signal transduction histidine kinase
MSSLLPKTMASRLYLILFTGLLIAHGLSFGLLFYERYVTANSMMLSNLERDVTTSVAMLDRIPASERGQWVPRFERRTYRYILGPGETGGGLASERARQVTRAIGVALGDRYPVRGNSISTEPEQFQVHLTLSDGSPLTIEVTPSTMPIAKWLPFVLVAQVLLLLLCAWAAVRLATRPLARLASAAESLSPSGDGPPLQMGGPMEVAKAITAFNAMQDRIGQYLRERLQILAAISHDLQTPITRMKLRTEAMDESPERGKLIDDLTEMEHLVRDGVAYARSVHSASEPARRVDLDAFLDSLVCDYQDTGKTVTMSGHLGQPLTTRPLALRRVLGNLLDNAIKYAGAAELHVTGGSEASVSIAVLDRGPGIPDDELESVMQPFYRLEASRNRDTGGAGLGLAIAQQLAISIGGTLALHNREGGGLQATLTIEDLDDKTGRQE